MTPQESPRIYFTAVFTYRKKSVLLLAGFFAVFGAFAVWRGTDRFRTVNIGVMAVAGICFALAGWLVFQFQTGRTLTSLIDSAGISSEGTHWPWEKVAWLAGQAQSDGIRLLFHLKGPLKVDHYVWSDHGLSQTEYDCLITNLIDEVKTRFPDIQFG